MKRAGRRQQGLEAIELIEQAIHELRAAPPATFASYYVGALPFVLALLFFWADMSRSAFAGQHLAGAALGVAALFLWMKFWQAVFARNLRASFAGEPPPPLGLRQCRRIFIAQTALQPSGLFLLPLAFLVALPAAWVCAFYQNLTAFAAAETGEVRSVLKNAARQAALWPRQNHTLLAILLGFGFYVFLNWTTVCLLLPQLTKMLLGVESVYTRSPLSLLNTTFLAAMFGLTYLSVDPIVKTVYALRCFYGESLESGEDLKAELKRLAAAAQPATALLLLVLLLSSAPSTSVASPPPLLASPSPPLEERVGERRPFTRRADNPSGAASTESVSPGELDRTIQEVLQQTKYAWRMPREKLRVSETEEPGIIRRYFQRVGGFLRREIKAFSEWLGKWLRKLFRHQRQGGSSGYGWIILLEVLMYALLAAVVIGLGLLLVRLWRNWNRQPGAIPSQPIQPAPDLADENLGAEQLSEDHWMTLGRQLLERGELRLAVRAFYFASLAHLAEHNLISLARFKSNRDYERELRRRGHSFPDLVALFGENVQVIDCVWYGLHEVNAERVSRFATNVERIKTGA
jgi:hypothetical protein